MEQREMRRVTTLKKGGQWFHKKGRSPDLLFENDCIINMTDIANTTQTHFEIHGIKTIVDMKFMTTSHMPDIKKDK
jgi:hypothetical protein